MADDDDERLDEARGPSPDDDLAPTEVELLRDLIGRIASLAGTFDLAGAGIALDTAEEAGVDTASGRSAVVALLAIRSALMQRELWPPGESRGRVLLEPHTGDDERVASLFRAAEIVEARSGWYGRDNSDLSGVVRWVARLVGGMPKDGTSPLRDRAVNGPDSGVR